MSIDALLSSLADKVEAMPDDGPHEEAPERYIHEVFTFALGAGGAGAHGALALFLDRQYQEHGGTLVAAIPTRVGSRLAVPGQQPEAGLLLVMRRPPRDEQEWQAVQQAIQAQRDAEARAAEAHRDVRLIQ